VNCEAREKAAFRICLRECGISGIRPGRSLAQLGGAWDPMARFERKLITAEGFDHLPHITWALDHLPRITWALDHLPHITRALDHTTIYLVFDNAPHILPRANYTGYTQTC
jgi:hypothetical protein